jgi:hypothetical protein
MLTVSSVNSSAQVPGRPWRANWVGLATSAPSQLKAWIDRVAQVGRTFKYTEKGPQGLAMGAAAQVA